MNKEKNFLDGKKIALQKLENAISEGKVDKKILSVLKLVNTSDGYYTTSSCAGRIVLLELPEIGDKKNAKFLGKWHRTIDIEELLKAKENAIKGQLWLLAQSPILHVVTKTESDADEMIKLGISCGFKNSGARSLGKRIIVEICSTERLDMPIGKDGEVFCDKEYLNFLVELSNDVIKRSSKKLDRFEKKLNNF